MNTVYAAPGDLVVEFENTPLFSEGNFIPGGEVAKWVKVSNNTSEPHPIIVEAINKINPNGLGDLLNLQIKENGNVLYNDSLSNFFNSGELVMSNLSGNSSTTYDFIVGFDKTTNSDYQEKNLGFDLLIGFQGHGGQKSSDGQFNISSESSASYLGSVGGSGGPYQGLLISNEASPFVSGNDVTITWNTSYYSTSQVIFGPDSGGPYNLNIALPNFGYASSSPDFLNKVLNHSVTIYNLPPGNYLYRVVSHASPPTISFEHSFVISAIYNTEDKDSDFMSSQKIIPNKISLSKKKMNGNISSPISNKKEFTFNENFKNESSQSEYKKTNLENKINLQKNTVNKALNKSSINNSASVISSLDEGISKSLKYILISLFSIFIIWMFFFRNKES